MSETFAELIDRWGEAMAGRAAPLTSLERALVHCGNEDAYLQYTAMRAALEAAKELVSKYQLDEYRGVWDGGTSVYIAVDKRERDIALEKLIKQLDGLK